MSDSLDLDSNKIDTQQLEGAAVVFAALGVLLYQEPTESSIGELLEEDFFLELPIDAENEMIEKGHQELIAWTHDAKERDLSKVVDELKVDWLKVLVGYGEPMAPCWASFYFEKDPQIFGRKTLEVREWYAKYGLMIERKYHEPDDHLGLMLQFVSMLVAREAEAIEARDTAAAAEYQSKEEEFIKQNILLWVAHWQGLVETSANTGFYRGIALLISGVIQEFMKRFDD